MLRVTWRNLVARKVRLLLSAFAIVLGVAFVAGSLIFTGAMGGAFDDIIEGSTADVEIAYEGANTFESQEDARVMPASVADELEQLPEVGSVHPTTNLMSVFVIGEDDKVVGGNGAPGLGFNPTDATAITGKKIITVAEGELPDGPDEVALDEDTAEKAGYEVGDTVPLVTPGSPPTMEAELTGIVQFGAGGLNGATLTLMDLEFMQDRFFGGEDVYNAISLNAAEGVSQQELADAVQPLLPEGVVAKTGDESVEENQATIDEVMGFLNTFLLVFAAVSLVVGTFLIINTFSILVAQRSRELALLRALGASRRQVNRSVLLEAVGVGIIGSTLGLVGGYLLALGLKALFGTFGLDLAGAEFPVTWTTIVVSYAVGILVTVVAAYLPARRAARVAPVQALRDDVAMPEASLRVRMLVGALLVAVGAASIAAGLLELGGEVLLLLGGGALAVLIGAALLSPLVGRPVVRAFGVLFRPFGTVGQLATENSLRNPRRTAATASALMIGLALMAMMSILGSSASASTDKAIEESLTSEYIVSNAVGQPFSPDIARQIAELDSVDTVASLRYANPELEGGGSAWMGAVDPTAFASVMRVPMEAGSLAELTRDKALVSSQVAEDRDLGIGDTVTLKFQGGDVDVQIAGITDAGASLPVEWVVTQETLEKGGLKPLDSMVFVTKAEGATTAELREGVDAITESLPTVTLKDPQEFADEQKGQINQFLYLIYGLLALSVLIALLGVVNTLALSVIERTREVGLLRAIGVSRTQLRTMIRLESMVIAVFGALLGVLIGVVFGVSLISTLEDEGLTELVVPWAALVAFVVGAAVLGVLAAVFPARRAARLDVLRAITAE
ncbi:ABC transporter permease [Nocardioides caldifontis]|uniref:ABC transporter permease n=1 Tax=Nocardioides caldifontis TaxID=2588938 RepID=UPI0011DF6FCD|nr:FtsX-like permease family protein [Nocardioides caldifontis]